MNLQPTVKSLRRPGTLGSRLLLMGWMMLASACASVPVTERQQLNLVPESTMVSASQDQYQEFLQNHEVIRNTPESEMVKRVGQNIRQAVEEFMARRGESGELAGYNWEFNLIASEEVNAFAMPGGKVAIFSGILPIAQNEAGLATIMGHEVAHVIARHGSERMSQQLITQMGGQALSALLATQPQTAQTLWMQVFGVGAQVGVMLPYSRLQESEADYLGLIFMAMAGYDPRAAVDVWQRMAQLGGAGVPEFLSTHPADQTRIREIQEKLPEALQYYQP
ncbi:MAG: M48 family metallopeptidase [Syntrophotaleaceae bacterium]